MSNSSRNTKWIGIALSVIMLTLVVLQFMPFWRYQGESLSIAGYIWRPYEHSEFTSLFKSYFGKSFKVSLFFALPMAITLIANAIGTVLFFLKQDSKVVYLLPVASAIIGIYGFLSTPAYQLGSSWIVHLILNILMLITGVLGLAIRRRNQ